jgi:hypothetical protein
LQSIASSNLLTSMALPSAANGYNGAAVIGNDYALGGATTATIDTMGTQFGAVIAADKTLTLGAGSRLNVVNGSVGSFGTGWFGAAGATTIGNGVILATGNTATSGAGT